MTSYWTAALLLAGALFMLLAAIGLLRLPDLFTRMSATSKAAGLGSSLSLLAVAVHFNELDVTTRAIAAIVFIFMTIPVAAHMIGRAGYLSQVAISSRTVKDELDGMYDRRSFTLQGRSSDGSDARSRNDDDKQEGP